MNQQAFHGMTIAVLATNGFEEAHFVSVQKALRGSGAKTVVISTDNGLITGMSATGWGHNQTVDAQLNTALGVDYDAVIVLGGQGDHSKFRATAHTKRFIGSLEAAEKPIIAMGNAAKLVHDLVLMSDDVCVIENADGGAEQMIKDALAGKSTLDMAA